MSIAHVCMPDYAYVYTNAHGHVDPHTGRASSSPTRSARSLRKSVLPHMRQPRPPSAVCRRLYTHVFPHVHTHVHTHVCTHGHTCIVARVYAHVCADVYTRVDAQELGLPAAIDAVDASMPGLPDRLKARVRAARDSGGAAVLDGNRQMMLEVIANNQQLMQAADATLSAEADDDQRYRARFGYSWTRQPSSELQVAKRCVQSRANAVGLAGGYPAVGGRAGGG